MELPSNMLEEGDLPDKTKSHEELKTSESALSIGQEDVNGIILEFIQPHQSKMFDAKPLVYCTICYMEVNEVLILKCEHYFCKDCTVAYLDNLISTR